MFALWFVHGLPALYDIKWFMILGGYLSKKNNPVPAGKFNAGQKMWFWQITFGGMIMGFTGFLIYFFNVSLDVLRVSAIIHNILGIVLSGFFIVHLYMTVFAIRGCFYSMISGEKGEEEAKILHGKYHDKLIKEGKI
jgi:formate dehydrogenase subunit gamma